jgi:uncharacterized membrane protein
MVKPVQIIKHTTSEIHAYFTFKRVFYIGIILKGIDGVIELFTAIALFFINPDQIHQLVALATREELAQDPHDFLANLLLNNAGHISRDAITFLIVYLLIHAAVKLVAVLGIILKRMWAYPFALVTLSLLTLYQFYKIAIKPSVGMILLTILDIIVIWMIAREYGRIRAGKDPNMIA